MKFIKLFAYSITFCLALAACKKHVIEPLPISDPSGQAQIKVVYASAYTTNNAVQIKINDTRVSNNITYSTPFPGGGLNTGGGSYPYYLSSNPGAIKIAISIPKKGATNVDSISLSTNTVNVDAGKIYSIYLADTSTNTQAIIIDENITPVQGDFSRFKFVNVMPDQPSLDLYFAGELVASNIVYKGKSTEFNLVRGAVGQWALRVAGADPTSVPLAVYPATGQVTIPFGRIMSVYARGYGNSTGTKAPAISLLYN